MSSLNFCEQMILAILNPPIPCPMITDWLYSVKYKTTFCNNKNQNNNYCVAPKSNKSFWSKINSKYFLFVVVVAVVVFVAAVVAVFVAVVAVVVAVVVHFRICFDFANVIQFLWSD